MITATEVQAAVEAAEERDGQEPAPEWAILAELAGAIATDQVPAPEAVCLLRYPDRGPILGITARTAEDGLRWIQWWGADHWVSRGGYPSHRRVFWRGWEISVSSPKAV